MESMDITTAAIATLISCSVSACITLYINRENALKNFNDQLDSILKISIQYPHLENPSFTSRWMENRNNLENNDEYLRYENYCCLVFNYMERFCKYHNYSESKIQNRVNIKGWIRIHKECWMHPSIPFENADGYSQEFKNLINKFLS